MRSETCRVCRRVVRNCCCATKRIELRPVMIEYSRKGEVVYSKALFFVNMATVDRNLLNTAWGYLKAAAQLYGLIVFKTKEVRCGFGEVMEVWRR